MLLKERIQSPVSPSSFEPAPQESEPAPSSSLRIDDFLPEPAQETATEDDGYTPPPLEFIRERTERRREKYRQQDAAGSPPPVTPSTTPPRTTFAASGTRQDSSAPADRTPSPAPSERRGMSFWKKAALAVTAAALAISTTVAGFLNAQKIQQAFRPPSEPPAPPTEHVQKAPSPADILDTASQYQQDLTTLQNMGGAALAEKPDATPIQKAVATATDTLYQSIDQKSGAAQGTSRTLFDAAAQRRDATETVFEQAEQDVSSQSNRNQNVFAKAWNVTRNAMVSIASAVGIGTQKTNEQALMNYMHNRDREQG